MARRIGILLVFAVLSLVVATLPPIWNTALAAGLDQEGKVQAKAAMGLFKQGLYEDAARIFAKLSVDYPDMEIFERNLGACLFYMRKPDAALSSLRRYLARKQNIAPDDKAVVDRWINQMEQLRAQNAKASGPSAPPPTPVSTPPLPQAEPATPAPTASLSPSTNGVSGKAPNPPAGVDFTARPNLADTSQDRGPFYKTWWFWTGTVAVVVASTVTIILLAGRSNNPCDGADRICLGVP